MNKAGDILRETQCLTEEQMRKYLRGELDREEVRKVELHIASCDFCADALDGLSEMEEPENLPVIVSQIRSRFSRYLRAHRASGKKKKHYIWLVLMAFIILLILLLAYYAIDFTMKGERAHPSPPVQEQQNNIYK